MNGGISRASSAERVVHSTFAALDEGRFPDALEAFEDSFTFVDHGLQLTFVAKDRLLHYFEKLRQVLPRSALEARTVSTSADRVVVEWKLTGAHDVALGPHPLRQTVVLRGVSIVELRNGRIAQWSDYYDRVTSRRFDVAASFEEWIEP